MLYTYCYLLALEQELCSVTKTYPFKSDSDEVQYGRCPLLVLVIHTILNVDVTQLGNIPSALHSTIERLGKIQGNFNIPTRIND